MPEVTYCIEAVIEKYPDGRILCPLLETGGSCEECVEILERRAVVSFDNPAANRSDRWKIRAWNRRAAEEGSQNEEASA